MTNNDFCIATKTDGTLWAWGTNSYGALGQNNEAPHHKSSPTQIPGTDWSDIVCGQAGNLALQST